MPLLGNTTSVSPVTGLIYLLIIALWAVVLVPKWLKHHDEKRNRPAEPAEVARSLESQHRAEAGNRANSWGEYLRHSLQSDGVQQVTSVLRNDSQRPAVRRRRRILFVLGGLVAASVLGGVVGVVPSVVTVLATFLLCGYVTALWYATRREGASANSLAGVDSRRPHAESGFEQSTSEARSTDGVRVIRGSDGRAWEPVETTLPTYVNKTKASKVPRRIDLAHGYSGADMVAQARAQQASDQYAREWAAVEPDPDEEVQRYASPGEVGEYYRRAVNE